ncbi:hypothetical protein HNQ92_001719 [Rhabdobacter roseus]|uniref:Helix-turn-helix domain-containing protein n=1 Tax=Rhabdobacter roseus TaxID=1655419 RepID=A0A840TQS7_9BACT|nr:DUF3853 family protein [Rhabdobacter roseus]MBB5283593.1 hypothetical protein [Rhabdobacter roseus]
MSTSLISAETPISQLTVGELVQVLSLHLPSHDLKQPQVLEKKYVYGIAGLARLIGCSHPTAHRLKSSGKIPYSQIGRKIVFEESAVLSALNKKGKR